MGSAWAVGIFAVGALGEFVADKLPTTPARTAAVGLTARIVIGLLTGTCLGVAGGASYWLGALIGAIGAIAGAFGGYQARVRLVQPSRSGSAIAIPEDLVAIGLDRCWFPDSEISEVLRPSESRRAYDHCAAIRCHHHRLRAGGYASRQRLRQPDAHGLIDEKCGRNCINDGCTLRRRWWRADESPSHWARRRLGSEHRRAISIDLRRVRQRKRDIVDKFRNGSQARIEKTANLELISARLGLVIRLRVQRRLTSARTMALSASLRQIYLYRHRAARPKVNGSDDVPTLDNVPLWNSTLFPSIF